MKILITGNKGFIGSRLSKILEDHGHTIIGLDLKAGWDRDKIYNTQNILSCDLPDNVDLVIHLAGIGGVRESLADPKKYWDNNVEGTRRILEHYKNVRVLVAGSSSQYEPHLNPYAASKHLIEFIPHPDVCFMRFHTTYNDSARTGMFFDKLFKGTLEYVTEHYRDFIHLEDLCRAIHILIENPEAKGAFDIGTGVAVKIKDIRSDLPVKKDTVGERLRTQANTEFMEKLGFKAEITVKDFLKDHNFEM